MKLKEFNEAIKENDFQIGDSFFINEWEFKVIRRI